MATTTRLVLDVLKPHQPSIVELAGSIAAACDAEVRVRVAEVDEKTETVVVEIEGPSLDFESIVAAVRDFGASLHSIDEVVVRGDSLGGGAP